LCFDPRRVVEIPDLILDLFGRIVVHFLNLVLTVSLLEMSNILFVIAHTFWKRAEVVLILGSRVGTPLRDEG